MAKSKLSNAENTMSDKPIFEQRIEGKVNFGDASDFVTQLQQENQALRVALKNLTVAADSHPLVATTDEILPQSVAKLRLQEALTIARAALTPRE